MPTTSRGNKHLIVMTTLNDGIICYGGISEKTRYEITHWMKENFFPWFDAKIIHTHYERWFKGYFSSFLEY